MAGQLFANLLFSAIGFVAFAYGKRQAELKRMVLGGALMVYPYCVSNILAVYIIGALLTAAAFVWRD